MKFYAYLMAFVCLLAFQPSAFAQPTTAFPGDVNVGGDLNVTGDISGDDAEFDNIDLPPGVGTTRGNLFFAGRTTSNNPGMRMFYNTGGLNNVDGGFIDVRTQTATQGLLFRVANGSQGGIPRMLIQSTGRVGIGTTNPLAQLNVRGNNILLSSPAGGQQFAAMGESGGGPNNAACDLYGFRAQYTVENSITLGVQEDGRGILNLGNDGQPFEIRVGAAQEDCGEIAGEFNSQGFLSPTITAKEFIVSKEIFVETGKGGKSNGSSGIANARELLSQLRGVSFAKKGSYGIDPVSMEAVLPGAVRRNEEGNVLLNYNAIIPLLLEDAVAQDEIINELENRLDAQQRQIQELIDVVKGGSPELEIKLPEPAVRQLGSRPNPANSETVVDYEIGAPFSSARLLVFNMAGQQLVDRSLTAASGSERLDVSSFVPGTYVYLIQVDGVASDRKLMTVVR